MTDRRPPHSMEAEESVIGGILVHAKMFIDAQEHCKAADFYHPALRAIFEAFVELDLAGKPIDALTVIEQMKAMETFDKLRSGGGIEYLNDLAGKVVTSENIGYHAKIVANRARMREVVAAAADIQADGYEEQSDPEEFLARSEKRIFELTMTASRSQIEHVKPVLYRVMKIVEARVNAKSAVTGIPTGSMGLDSLTAGLQPGHLIILGGRPSMGKTSVLLNWMMNASIHHLFPGLILSFETSKEEILEKCICIDGRIDTERMRVGALATTDWVRTSTSAARLAEAPLMIDDQGATLGEIRSKVRRWRMDQKIWTPRKVKIRTKQPWLKADGELGVDFEIWTPPFGIVGIDYLQLVEAEMAHSGRSGNDDNRAIVLGKVSRGLKLLARETHSAIVALVQLGRQVDARGDKRPLLSDIKESGAIEQDADEVAFCYRDEYYSKDECKPEDQDVIEIIVGKQRNGRTSTVRMHWEKTYTRLSELPSNGQS